MNFTFLSGISAPLIWFTCLNRYMTVRTEEASGQEGEVHVVTAMPSLPTAAAMMILGMILIERVMSLRSHGRMLQFALQVDRTCRRLSIRSCPVTVWYLRWNRLHNCRPE
jgi:hypothetical protein